MKSRAYLTLLTLVIVVLLVTIRSCSERKVPQIKSPKVKTSEVTEPAPAKEAPDVVKEVTNEPAAKPIFVPLSLARLHHRLNGLLKIVHISYQNKDFQKVEEVRPEFLNAFIDYQNYLNRTSDNEFHKLVRSDYLLAKSYYLSLTKYWQAVKDKYAHRSLDSESVGTTDHGTLSESLPDNVAVASDMDKYFHLSVGTGITYFSSVDKGVKISNSSNFNGIVTASKTLYSSEVLSLGGTAGLDILHFAHSNKYKFSQYTTINPNLGIVGSVNVNRNFAMGLAQNIKTVTFFEDGSPLVGADTVVASDSKLFVQGSVDLENQKSLTLQLGVVSGRTAINQGLHFAPSMELGLINRGWASKAGYQRARYSPQNEQSQLYISIGKDY